MIDEVEVAARLRRQAHQMDLQAAAAQEQLPEGLRMPTALLDTMDALIFTAVSRTLLAVASAIEGPEQDLEDAA